MNHNDLDFNLPEDDFPDFPALTGEESPSEELGGLLDLDEFGELEPLESASASKGRREPQGKKKADPVSAPEDEPDWADTARHKLFRASDTGKKFIKGLTGEASQEDLQGDGLRARILRSQNAIVDRLTEQQAETEEIPDEQDILRARYERLKEDLELPAGEQPRRLRAEEPPSGPSKPRKSEDPAPEEADQGAEVEPTPEKKSRFVFLNMDLSQAEEEEASHAGKKKVAISRDLPEDDLITRGEPEEGQAVENPLEAGQQGEAAPDLPRPKPPKGRAKADQLEEDSPVSAPQPRRRPPVEDELDEEFEEEFEEDEGSTLSVGDLVGSVVSRFAKRRKKKPRSQQPAGERGEAPMGSALSVFSKPITERVTKEDFKAMEHAMGGLKAVLFFGVLVLLFLFGLLAPLRHSNGQAVEAVDATRSSFSQIMDGSLTGNLESKYNTTYPLGEKMAALRANVAGHLGGQVDTDGIYSDGAAVPPLSMEAPVLELEGGSAVTVFLNNRYDEPGYTATDVDGTDLTAQVTVTGEVDTSTEGTYQLTYTVVGADGMSTSVIRTVKVCMESIAIVDPGPKTVYLTFDDGPYKYTQELLDVLAKYDVKVTFFVTNQYPDYQDLIAAEAAAGHTVAVHTYSHDYKGVYTSVQSYVDDLNKMNEIIYEQTGSYSRIFRFPGGSSNTISKKYCEGVVTGIAQELTSQGYRYFDWNVTSGDAGETTDTDTIVQNVIRGIQSQTEAGTSSVVLQHDVKDFSVAAVEEIIKWGLENGYQFLPLDLSSPDNHHTINN